MSANSKIEWCDHTFNPWEGCTKVSAACANCYAAVRDERFTGGIHWGKGAPRRRTSAANWKEPLKWDKKAELTRWIDGVPMIYTGSKEIAGKPETRTFSVCPASIPLNKRKPSDSRAISPQDWESSPRFRPRVFCASLADWLDDEVPIEWLADLMELIRATPNLEWLLLTKRPENWRSRLWAAALFNRDRAETARRELCRWIANWVQWGNPPKNVWIGATVENQSIMQHRHRALMAIPARVHFWSSEPLLGEIQVASEWIEFGAPDWVICGGESGRGENIRPTHPDWARSLRDQCKAVAVPFFFKQWGHYRLLGLTEDPGNLGPYEFSDGIDGGEGTYMIPVGKKSAGRLLDGVEHSAFPEAK